MQILYLHKRKTFSYRYEALKMSNFHHFELITSILETAKWVYPPARTLWDMWCDAYSSYFKYIYNGTLKPRVFFFQIVTKLIWNDCHYANVTPFGIAATIEIRFKKKTNLFMKDNALLMYYEIKDKLKRSVYNHYCNRARFYPRRRWWWWQWGRRRRIRRWRRNRQRSRRRRVRRRRKKKMRIIEEMTRNRENKI